MRNTIFKLMRLVAILPVLGLMLCLTPVWLGILLMDTAILAADSKDAQEFQYNIRNYGAPASILSLTLTDLKEALWPTTHQGS